MESSSLPGRHTTCAFSACGGAFLVATATILCRFAAIIVGYADFFCCLRQPAAACGGFFLLLTQHFRRFAAVLSPKTV